MTHLVPDAALDDFRIVLADILCRDLAEAHDDAVLVDLGADSLDAVEFAVEIEDRFARRVSDDVMAGWTTVGDVLRSIHGGAA